jgi:hypothetical protein
MKQGQLRDTVHIYIYIDIYIYCMYLLYDLYVSEYRQCMNTVYNYKYIYIYCILKN